MKNWRRHWHTLKRYGDMIRPFDIIIIIALLILSFTPHAIFAYQKQQQAEQAAQVAKKTHQKRPAQRTPRSFHMMVRS